MLPACSKIIFELAYRIAMNFQISDPLLCRCSVLIDCAATLSFVVTCPSRLFGATILFSRVPLMKSVEIGFQGVLHGIEKHFESGPIVS